MIIFIYLCGVLALVQFQLIVETSATVTFDPSIPTPPPVCEDKISNCYLYPSSTCTTADYTLWVDDNCKKTCGRCGGGQPSPAISGGIPQHPTVAGQPTQPHPTLHVTPAPMTPPVPFIPGKRDRMGLREAKPKRQFHASHHHAVDCWDSNNSTDRKCNTTTDGTVATQSTTPFRVTSESSGSEFLTIFHPHPITPEWDSKPNITVTVPVSKVTPSYNSSVNSTTPSSPTNVSVSPSTPSDNSTTASTQSSMGATISSTSSTTTSIQATPSITPSESTSIQATPSITPSETTSIQATPSIIPSTTTSIQATPSITPSTTISIQATPSSTPPATTSIVATPSTIPSTTTSIKATPYTTISKTISIESSPSTILSTTTSIVTTPSSTLLTPSSSVTPTATATTPSTSTPITTATPTVTSNGTNNVTPEPCEDLKDCVLFGRDICVDDPNTNNYLPFAKKNCPLYCAFCRPTTFVCKDVNPACPSYDDGALCTDPDYTQWVYENCMVYCHVYPCNGTIPTTSVF